jgi:hypothetical protein
VTRRPRPATSLRIPPALLARADELVPLVAATGELIVAHAPEATARTKMLLVMRHAPGA